MSRRGGKDRFTKTWSKDQAEQQKRDRAQQVPTPDDDAITYASGGFVPVPMTKSVIDEYARGMSRKLAFNYVPGGATTPSPAFAGSEFAMGTAVGVRSWDVDKLGRLQSPSYRMTWTPNEMVAECRRVDELVWRINSTNGVSVAIASDVKAVEVDPNHKQSECACGFYAYYDGFNEYAHAERITGVIEGYGETQIGTRGFKSAKARIVALYVPAEPGVDVERIGKTPFQRVCDNYGQHVAIFDDYAQMLAEFPTTQPEPERTPDTDPDFWTRSA